MSDVMKKTNEDCKDFRKLPLNQSDSGVFMERLKIRELLEYERYCRDNKLYDEAESCYSEDAKIHVTWFNGTAKEYFDITKKMKQISGCLDNLRV